MFNMYRKYIPRFAHITKPISDLTRGHEMTKKGSKGTPISWTPECQEALDTLVEAVNKDVVLAYPNFLKPFFI